MATEAVVQQVGELLCRSHTLFAEPADAGAAPAAESGERLADAGQRLHEYGNRTAQLGGQLASDHGRFVVTAEREVSALAGSDDQLGRHLTHIAVHHQRGRANSAAIIDAAAADTAALAPLNRIPAGQYAVLIALRTRLAQQQRLLADTTSGALAAAAAVRSLTYPSAANSDGPDEP